MIMSYDTKTAAVDALLSAWGASPNLPHPLAETFAAAPLSKMAEICGQTTRPPAGATARVIQARGISTGDFSDVIARAATTFAVNRYHAAANHLAFCAPIEAVNFMPVEIASISTAGALARVGENGEVQRGKVTMHDIDHGQLICFASNLVFSREVVINDQANLVSTALAQFGNATSLTEAQQVYGALLANPTLRDGAPVFHAEFNNLQGALSDTTLAAGLAALRKGVADVVDLPAAHLIVAADLEYAAAKLVRDAGLPLFVTATALLPNGQWYLLPDPAIQPVLGVIRLKSAKNPVRLEPAPTPIEVDGFTIRASVEVGVAMLSRHAIKGGA